MKTNDRSWRRCVVAGGFCALLGALLVPSVVSPRASADSHLLWWRDRCACNGSGIPAFAGSGEEPSSNEVGGSWYWIRSPEQEKRVVMGLFNRYCIRCHVVDGRGVWDVPDVPNFTNARWQSCRTDGQLARAILEGRGSVMPPWRGVLSLEEAWAMSRYVRTFVPGSEASRPDFNAPEKGAKADKGEKAEAAPAKLTTPK
jgi:hypothetical protein